MKCPENSTSPILCQDGEYCDVNKTETQSGTVGYVDPRDATG